MQPIASSTTHANSVAQQPTIDASAWPGFPVPGWDQTGPTLHRWTQVVGKVRLALSPPQNHFWHSTLYVSPQGLTTSPIPYRAESFQINFDFIAHQLLIATSWGPRQQVALAPKSVAAFYAEVMAALRGLGIDVSIWTHPVEMADRIPFDQDHGHAAYDPTAAHAFWRVLLQADRVFKQFRGRFLGKSSPVHFFWGSFDLAVTRFSGRRGPMWSGPALNVHPHVMHESYSHEVSSAGFWPGDATAPPMFYSYAVPGPPGLPEAAVSPGAAAYNHDMGEFVLPYERVRAADRPDELLHAFLQTTYAAAADLGAWERPLLEESPACLCDVEGRPQRHFP